MPFCTQIPDAKSWSVAYVGFDDKVVYREMRGSTKGIVFRNLKRAKDCKLIISIRRSEKKKP